MSQPGIKYGNGVDLVDPNTSHSRMLRLIGNDKRVLEFGCSSGYLSQALQRQGCTVMGLEIDPAAAEDAKMFCERVIVADLDRKEWAEQLGVVSFDAALFGDVLEHLKNPTAVLAKVRDFLAPDGFVVASIPNIAHGSVRLALLEGNFQYRPLGLLDDTHLRFFTRRSIDEMFRIAGYVVDNVERARLDIFDTEIDVRNYGHPEELIRKLREDDDALTYQYIYKALPVNGNGTNSDESKSKTSVPAFAAVNQGAGLASREAVLHKHVQDTEQRIQVLQEQIALSEETLRTIMQSRGWRLLNRYHEGTAALSGFLKSLLSMLWARKREMVQPSAPQIPSDVTSRSSSGADSA